MFYCYLFDELDLFVVSSHKNSQGYDLRNRGTFSCHDLSAMSDDECGSWLTLAMAG